MRGNQLLPVLIVAFARKEKVQKTVDFLLSQNRNILIFVDNSCDSQNSLNLKMINYAQSLSENDTVTVKIANYPLGVGKAVPEAVSWALTSHAEVIILEDDCFLVPGALEYFDQMIGQLDSQIRLVSGLSPNDFAGELVRGANCTLAHYPLIWGWATNRDSWDALWSMRNKPIDPIKVFFSIAQRELRLSALSFFKAAMTRIKSGKLKAWDAEMTFFFLLRGFKAIIPNTSLIINTGFDSVASNTTHSLDMHSEIVNQPSECEIMLGLDRTREATSITDRLIEKRIYSMKKRHLFSFLKALLIK